MLICLLKFKGGEHVDQKQMKLIYSIIGSLMLILLQSQPFQDALGFSNLVGILYLGDWVFFLTDVLSFLGVGYFIVSAIKLLLK